MLILAPEAYLPLRAVGAQFHASADGLAAADEAFAVIEEPAPPAGEQPAPEPRAIRAAAGRRRRGQPAGPAQACPGRGLFCWSVRGEITGSPAPAGTGNPPCWTSCSASSSRRRAGSSSPGRTRKRTCPRSTRTLARAPGVGPAGPGPVPRDGRGQHPARLARRARRGRRGRRARRRPGRRAAQPARGRARRRPVRGPAPPGRPGPGPAPPHGQRPVLLLDEPTAGPGRRTEARVLRHPAGRGRRRAGHPDRRAPPRVLAIADRMTPLPAAPDGPDGPGALALAGVAPATGAVPAGVAPVAGAAEPPPLRKASSDPDEAGEADDRGRTGRWLTLAGAAGTLAAVCSIGLLATSAWLISRAAQRPPVLYLMVAVTAVQAFAIGRSVFRYAERLASHDAALRILARLRMTAYDRLERLAPAGLGRLPLRRPAQPAGHRYRLPRRPLAPGPAALRRGRGGRRWGRRRLGRPAAQRGPGPRGQPVRRGLAGPGVRHRHRRAGPNASSRRSAASSPPPAGPAARGR